MKSPIYENSETKGLERKAMACLAGIWRCGFVKLHMEEHIDFLCHDSDEILALVEYKRRNCDKFFYKDYAIDASRIEHGLVMAAAMGVDFFLLIEWDDALGLMLCRHMGPQQMGGRFDRNDRNDYEMQAHYELGAFITLEGFK